MINQQASIRLSDHMLAARGDTYNILYNATHDHFPYETKSGMETMTIPKMVVALIETCHMRNTRCCALIEHARNNQSLRPDQFYLDIFKANRYNKHCLSHMRNIGILEHIQNMKSSELHIGKTSIHYTVNIPDISLYTLWMFALIRTKNHNLDHEAIQETIKLVTKSKYETVQAPDDLYANYFYDLHRVSKI